MLLKDRSISQSMIAAVSAIGKVSADKYFSERRALEEKMAVKQMKMPNQPAPKADAPAHTGAADMAKKNIKAVKEAAEGSHPRTEKEKQLAKLHGDPNKITHGDVLKGRGVRKEAFADMMRDVKARHDKDEKEKGTGKFDKKITSTGTVYTRKSSTFDDGGKDTDMKKAEKKMKSEEVEASNKGVKGISGLTGEPIHIHDARNKAHVESRIHHHLVSTHKYDKKEASGIMQDMHERHADDGATHLEPAGAYGGAKPKSVHHKKVGIESYAKDMAKHLHDSHQDDLKEEMSRAAKGHEKYGKEGMQALAKAGKEGKALDPVRKKYDKYEELDTPGNSTHQCAIHVKSEQFGEGRTLTSQHAEPDTNGNIAWYDVMFAEGIKRVETKDIEVLVSEAHMMHKKKKKM